MLTLVLGGTRSGKTSIAETLTGRESPATVLATANVSDPQFGARVAAHRAARPAAWETVETATTDGGLVQAVIVASGPVLVDSLGTWLATFVDFAAPTDALLAALAGRSEPTVVVSEEVGLSVHPTSPAGRAFIDALGTLNQRVAALADRSILVVAGRVLELADPPGTPPR